MLAKFGAQCADQSDTEVLLKTYARSGEACLDVSRGMYAFGSSGARDKSLFIARMRIKPLYYYAADPYFLLASEVRKLFGTGLVTRQPDHAGLLNYLDFGSVYDPHTLIEGVKSLRLGHYFRMEEGAGGDVLEIGFQRTKPRGTEPATRVRGDREGKSWTMNYVKRYKKRSPSPDQRCVPVVVSLSGRIDSSSLVALLSRNDIQT